MPSDGPILARRAAAEPWTGQLRSPAMIIEHHVFRLAAGVDEADFLAADVGVQTGFAPFQHGFIRRTTARGADGEWLVETFWFGDDDARAAAQSDHPTVVALAACIDPASERRDRFQTLE